ncbi:MAG: hypothetical protein K0R82_1185 [Flavipsychrobacter sp.]|nr:hypothetical protein [Flavipsychrobacter sp.]
MKSMFKAMALAITILSPLLSSAQAPMKFNYQGIVRGAGGVAVAGKPVGVRLSVLDGSPVGTAQYVETHTVNTNQYGLFNVTVGGGTPVTGTMNDVAWSTGDKYLKVEFDPAGGTVYTDLGATQLVSVPFALRARQLDTLLPLVDTLNITTPFLGVSTPLLAITNIGNANVAEFSIDNVNSTSAALRAYINSQYDNGGSAAVYAEAAGPGGDAGQFRATDPSGHADALSAFASGTAGKRHCRIWMDNNR